ncbi:hypothetical protein D9757_014150 [Collybiopsis confluens]|uniref:FAD/NAD(P)-binding domain-containing protein n=1 Tax=Collybiopsis confluens TaxID=2823264 RepID=A0A8H5FQ29_9AGAR|nr:hypothetical protein D9757_014150 [Collybiopsis confluens]
MADDSSIIRPKNVLVIGGGSAGLVTLRNLVERGQFQRVELVERRDDVGGVWYQNEPLIASENGTLINKPSGRPPHTQPFPTLIETYEYLRNFAKPYLSGGLVRLNSEVLRVEELPLNKGWKIRIRDWSACETNEGIPLDSEEIWDAVVVCAGYYDKPNWPNTEGLDAVRKRGLALHSKWWNGPDGYEGKRAIVIGNANSSNDIATQLAPVARAPVYRSMRRPTPTWFPHLPDARVENVGPVARYILQPPREAVDGAVNEKVTVVLQNGTEIKDVDVVILGTGYCPHPEFVHVLPIEVDDANDVMGAKVSIPIQTPSPPQTPPRHPSSPSRAYSDHPKSPTSTAVSIMSYTNPVLPHTRRIPFLYQHILYSYNPSLAFIGTILAITPFIVSDVASTWLALAWSGQVGYPQEVEKRLQFDRERVKEVERLVEAENRRNSREGEEDRTRTGMGIDDGQKSNGMVLPEVDSQSSRADPSSFITYCFLGSGGDEGAQGGEAGYANTLRKDVVGARKDLDGVLPVWDAEMMKARWDMFPTKYEALEWARMHCV